MQTIAEGDLRQVAVLFRRYRDPIFGYLVQQTRGNRRVAEDLLQDSFERLIKYRKSYRYGSSFRAWLFTIARNRLHDWRKQRQRQREQEEEVFFALPPGTGPYGQVDTSSLDRMVEQEEALDRAKALAQLPDNYREVVDLAWKRGLKYAEIAEVLQTTESNVKVRMHRACKQLKTNYFKIHS